MGFFSLNELNRFSVSQLEVNFFLEVGKIGECPLNKCLVSTNVNRSQKGGKYKLSYLPAR